MITSENNTGVKNVIALQKKGRERQKQGVFVAEGIKLFSETPKERLEKVYVAESFLTEQTGEEMLGNVRYEIVKDKIFREMSDTQSPQGILFIIKQFHYELQEILASSKPLLMILEDVQDPGNLGTILRAGEGAGITGVVMSKGTVDLYNPKVIRSTMGSIFRIPFVQVNSLLEVMEKVKEVCTVYAAHLKGNIDYDEADYTQGSAFLIGNEANGLQDKTAFAADCLVKIPMQGKVESLNAGIAASLLMYEAFRQRRHSSK